MNDDQGIQFQKGPPEDNLEDKLASLDSINQKTANGGGSGPENTSDLPTKEKMALNGENDPDVSRERIYEFTSDLNIAPANEGGSPFIGKDFAKPLKNNSIPPLTRQFPSIPQAGPTPSFTRSATPTSSGTPTIPSSQQKPSFTTPYVPKYPSQISIADNFPTPPKPPSPAIPNPKSSYPSPQTPPTSPIPQPPIPSIPIPPIPPIPTTQAKTVTKEPPLNPFEALGINQFKPPTPPTKSVTRQGMAFQSTRQEIKPAEKVVTTNLQDIVTSILPSDLRDKEKKPDVKPAFENAIEANNQNIRSSNVPIDPNIKALRTYEGDVAEILAHKQVSTASIAIAESKRQGGEERIGDKVAFDQLSNQTNESKTQEKVGSPNHSGLKWLIAIVSILLIGGGLTSAYYLYSLSPIYPQSPITPTQTKTPSLVPADSQTVLSIDNLNLTSIIKRVKDEASKTRSGNHIEEIIFTKKVNGSLTRVNGPEMLKLVDIPLPKILERSLAEPWMLGIYSDPSGDSSVFVIATTNFFQNSFAGMLQWEPTMSENLKLFLSSKAQMITIADTSSTTSSSSTTPELKPYFTLRGSFHDRIIKNRDVREFVNDNGEILFLYSFVDNSRLVITDSEAALSEIVTRLEKQAFMR